MDYTKGSNPHYSWISLWRLPLLRAKNEGTISFRCTVHCRYSTWWYWIKRVLLSEIIKKHILHLKNHTFLAAQIQKLSLISYKQNNCSRLKPQNRKKSLDEVLRWALKRWQGVEMIPAERQTNSKVILWWLPILYLIQNKATSSVILTCNTYHYCCM